MLITCLIIACLGVACSDVAEFPATYRTTYTEVRDCRASSDHDLHHIRVLADPAALEAYMGRAIDFPAGAVVLKEEYDFADEDCVGPIVEWTAMQKIVGSPDTLGWTWQHVAPDREVVTQDEARCINCHTTCGIAPDGYDGTCTLP